MERLNDILLECKTENFTTSRVRENGDWLYLAAKRQERTIVIGLREPSPFNIQPCIKLKERSENIIGL